MAKLIIDFAGGPLDGDTWYGETEAPPVTSDAIDAHPDMRPWIVAEVFAKTCGDIGRHFAIAMQPPDRPPSKFGHVLAVTVNKVGCLLEADYFACHEAEYEITDRLEHADELLLRAEYRGQSKGSPVVSLTYRPIKGDVSPFGWPLAT